MAYRDLSDRLNEYCHGDYVPMHMPGSKRNTDLFFMPNPYGLDITEIDGFDNLHHADGVLAEASMRCAKLFGADETLFLVNGSSAGVLAAICGATRKRDCVIAARNAHSSVYNALYLNELKPVYIYPQYYNRKAGICAGITAAQVQEAFDKAQEQKQSVSAVIITSPTYEGMISEVPEISKVAHAHKAALIVDEAHGAHFPFHEMFPESAVSCGADAVIQSIHKTLPSFTQTALLHLNKGRIDERRVKRYWDMYQTTSPSYLLMAGIDRCVSFLLNHGKEAFAEYAKRLRTLRKELSLLQNIKLLDTDDLSKIVLLAHNGKQLYDTFRINYHIQPEMASLKYMLAMTAVGDKPVYYERFLCAAKEIDKEYDKKYIKGFDAAKAKQQADDGGEDGIWEFKAAKRRLEIYDALNQEAEWVNVRSAVGRIAADKICFYPPGVPLTVPGEVISKECVALIKRGLCAGLDTMGLRIGGAYRGEYRNVDSGKRGQNIEEEVEILCLK